MSVSGGKKCLFFGKFGVLCFLETPVLRFALLPCSRLTEKHKAPIKLGKKNIFHSEQFSISLHASDIQKLSMENLNIFGCDWASLATHTTKTITLVFMLFCRKHPQALSRPINDQRIRQSHWSRQFW